MTYQERLLLEYLLGRQIENYIELQLLRMDIELAELRHAVEMSLLLAAVSYLLED